MAVYFKVRAFSDGESDESPAYYGLKVDAGFEREDITPGTTAFDVLSALNQGIELCFDISDASFITEEEYYRDYGYEWEDS